jgi:hypothetical protein
MPTVFRFDGFRVFFCSNEGDPREPVHVHAMGDGGEAEFWMRTEVTVARSAGLDARTLRRPAQVVEARRDEIERPGMSISAEGVRFEEDTMWVTLSDGRVLGVPLAWFPRLLHAAPEARTGMVLSPFGIHWEALDEDISVAG